MGKFQIGCVEGIWTNFVPPIRGGIFNKMNKPSASEDEGYVSDPPLVICSDMPSDDKNLEVNAQSSSCETLEGKKTCSSRIPSRQPSLNNISPKVAIESEKSNLASEAIPSVGFGDNCPLVVPVVPERLSPEAFTLHMEQREIDADLSKYPSLDLDTQQNIIRKYRELHEAVKAGGFYNCRYFEYAKESCRYAFLFGLFIYSLRSEWYMTSAIFLGLFWHQIMFVAHDAAHMGITHNFKIDTLIGIFVADFCCGLSIGWWKSSHNVHHLVTNHPVHDPDIQNVPLLATSPSFFKSIHSSYYDFTFVWDKAADFAVSFQHYTYYPIMCIARFNLYLLSWLFLFSNKAPRLGAASWTRPTELVLMIGYWYMFGYCLLWKSIPTWTLRVLFVLVSHIITMPLHIQITLSHFAMSTADLGEAESFPQKQLRTTMDVACPPWLDFIHGGLQFQAVHHLFPRVPRHNLRSVQVLVRKFCKDVGIEYKILGFIDGNKEVLGRLGEVAKQVEMLVACQKYMAETGESGLH
ncbi:MAG: hypothetical protein M1829_003210 [Trizodia sp. TS-e1964]|nr:MAG: hypothetical protein M1829_003210 [Trizodia sp. TS-e1964]